MSAADNFCILKQRKNMNFSLKNNVSTQSICELKKLSFCDNSRLD